MNEEIRVIEGKKVIEEIIRNQAVESIKRKRKRDERLAFALMALSVPVVYALFWLMG